MQKQLQFFVRGIWFRVARVCFAVALAAAGSGTCAVPVPAFTEEKVPLVMNVGFTRAAFSGVNEADVRAALAVFVARIGERHGYDIKARVCVFDEIVDLKEAIQRDGLDLVIMDTWDYLTCCPSLNMPIEFITVEQGVVRDSYVILTRPDSGITKVADLEGRRVFVLDCVTANNGCHWLRTEVLSVGGVNPDRFLGRLILKAKVSQVVLPVFFGQADACVVGLSGLKTLSEMNPQICRRLVAVAESPPFLETVCLVRRNGWQRECQREDLLSAMREFSSDPAGKQILTLFKFDQFIPFFKESLDAVRSLRLRYDHLVIRGTAETISMENVR